MTSETKPRDAGAFGEVLEELMRARNLEPSPENVRSLAARSRLDGDELLRAMIAAEARESDLLGGLRGLADELALSHEEKTNLGVAFAFGVCDVRDWPAASGESEEASCT